MGPGLEEKSFAYVEQEPYHRERSEAVATVQLAEISQGDKTHDVAARPGIRIEERPLPAFPHRDDHGQGLRHYGEGPPAAPRWQAHRDHRTARSGHRSLLRSLRGRLAGAYRAPGTDPCAAAEIGVNRLA